MFGFGQVKPAPTLVAMIGELQTRVSAVESQMRTLEVEQANLHGEVRKWMRRAVAAERRVEGTNQEPAPVVAPATPSPLPQTHMWGAAGRIAARQNGGFHGVRAGVQSPDAPAFDGSGSG